MLLHENWKDVMQAELGIAEKDADQAKKQLAATAAR